MDPQIKAILDRLSVLENKQGTELEARVSLIESRQGTVPVLAADPVTSSPTASGYIPFFVNGKRVNLLTGS